jgi:hypothetical protein
VPSTGVVYSERMPRGSRLLAGLAGSV